MKTVPKEWKMPNKNNATANIETKIRVSLLKLPKKEKYKKKPHIPKYMTAAIIILYRIYETNSRFILPLKKSFFKNSSPFLNLIIPNK